MDFDRLADEIAKRVAAKIGEQETDAPRRFVSSGDKPKLLVLTQVYNQRSSYILESEKLSAYFKADCAVMSDKAYDPAGYDAVVLFDLTIDAMAKLASAIADTSYTETALKAILTGKAVYVPNEEIEIYRYKGTTPAPYYAVLLEKLKLLTESGVAVCPAAELEGRILADAKNGRCVKDADAGVYAAITQKETVLNKKLITEKDVIETCMKGAARLLVERRAIITELARDYARERGLQIIRG